LGQATLGCKAQRDHVKIKYKRRDGALTEMIARI
jgi:hypothetical protein